MTLELEIQARIERIEDAITKVRNNEPADIKGMDNDVAALCSRIVRSDPATAKALEGPMLTMIARLDDLAAELKDYQHRIKK